MPEPLFTPRVLVITGGRAWAEPLATAAEHAGWQVRVLEAHTAYVARLAASRAALALVDASAEGWAFWVTAAKASPAARRIPIVVFAADPARAAEALQAGADSTAGPEALHDPAAVFAHARETAPDPALADACGEPLPPDAVAALHDFNSGAYYQQHDRFEALWMAEPGPVRELYRAVLQVGIGYYQITRGNGDGAYKMLVRALAWLDGLPPVCRGIDVAALRDDAAAVCAALEAAGRDAARIDRALLRPVRYTPG
jgi:hypothetical protein